MTNYAYQLKAKFDAGLQLVGQDAEGQLEWVGSPQQWQEAGRREEIGWRKNQI